MKTYGAHTTKAVCSQAALRPEQERGSRALLGSSLFFTVTGQNRALVSGHLISTLGTRSGFTYHFQRHKQEMIQFELALQSKLN